MGNSVPLSSDNLRQFVQQLDADEKAAIEKILVEEVLQLSDAEVFAALEARIAAVLPRR